MPLCKRCLEHCAVLEYPDGEKLSNCCSNSFYGEASKEEITLVDEDGEPWNKTE